MSIEVLSGPRSLRFSEEGYKLSEEELAGVLWRAICPIDLEDAKAAAEQIFNDLEDLNLAYREIERLDGDLAEERATSFSHSETISKLEAVNRVLKEELESLRTQALNRGLHTSVLSNIPQRHWNVGPYEPSAGTNVVSSIPQADGGSL